MTDPRIRPDDVLGYRRWVREFDPWSPGVGTKPRWSGDHDTCQDRLYLSAILIGSADESSQSGKVVSTVLTQSYPCLELWVPRPIDQDVGDSRLRVLAERPDESLAAWFDRALRKAVGEYVVPLLPFGALPSHALTEIVNAIANSPGVDLIYSDEDVHDERGLRMAPRFKTGWDPELMLGRNAVGHLLALRTERVKAVGGVDTRLSTMEAVIYDLVLRVAAMPGSGPVRHIPSVLFSAPNEASSWARTLEAATAQVIVAAHLDRLGAVGTKVVPADGYHGATRVIWPLPDPVPRVSIIIPTRDQATLLSRCVVGVTQNTDYPDLEVLIVDNGSVDARAMRVMGDLAHDERVRVLRHDAPFNYSTLNNRAVHEATGSVLVLLNDDTEVLEAGWLRELVSQALRPEVGMVGAKLLYPDGRVQHAGIVMESGGPHHQFRLCDGTDPGPNGELVLSRSVSAVTGACVAMRRSVFDEVGGLDEQFAVAFGDVDFCLRVAHCGYRIICTPGARLVHHESASRGYDDDPVKQRRLSQEVTLLRRRWEAELWTDRYANPRLFFGWNETSSWGLPRPVGRRRWMPGKVGRWGPMRALGRIVRAITLPVIPNPLFSPTWYLASYPEVAGYRPGPYLHWRRHGVRDGRNPNPMFDTLWYLERYPDVEASGMNPLDHYLRFGAMEKRDPSPGFNTKRYLSEHPDVAAAGVNPLEHYLWHGGSWH